MCQRNIWEFGIEREVGRKCCQAVDTLMSTRLNRYQHYWCFIGHYGVGLPLPSLEIKSVIVERGVVKGTVECVLVTNRQRLITCHQVFLFCLSEELK